MWPRKNNLLHVFQINRWTVYGWFILLGRKNLIWPAFIEANFKLLQFLKTLSSRHWQHTTSRRASIDRNRCRSRVCHHSSQLGAPVLISNSLSPGAEPSSTPLELRGRNSHSACRQSVTAASRHTYGNTHTHTRAVMMCRRDNWELIWGWKLGRNVPA